MLERLLRLFRRSSPPTAGVKARHAEELMRRKGVVSVGVGRDPQGREAIIVGVSDAFQAQDLPEEIEGVPLVIRQVGRIRARTTRGK